MKPSLKITVVSSPLFQRGGVLADFMIHALSSYSIREKMVVAISSKLFSLAENCIVQSEDKAQLIQREADYDLGESPYGFHLTIKEGLVLPSAGIDQSNSPTGDYLLFPKKPYLSLKKLWTHLREKWQVKQLGLLMTDSHTTPLRRGVTGTAVAHWGFKAVRDCRGQKDLYQRELKVTTVNNIDALASIAVWMMGEGDEQCPVALIENASLEWEEESSSQEIRIPLAEDLYKPLFEGKIKCKTK